jgi:hypothetical protein
MEIVTVYVQNRMQLVLVHVVLGVPHLMDHLVMVAPLLLTMCVRVQMVYSWEWVQIAQAILPLVFAIRP